MEQIPAHVAIILDGNGRWAKERKKPRSFGHLAGARTMLQILEDADELGIRYLTVYAFSTENWNRPKAEVTALMKILRKELTDAVERSMKNNVRCRVIGDRSGLDADIREAIANLETATKDNTGLQFTIAINYGSRDEMTRAVRRIAKDVQSGALAEEAIDEACVSSYLDTRDLPDPDLLIRTCNELRISNFLLWQSAYTEFYFTEKAWPDFDRAELEKAVLSYAGRDRRYGGIREAK
ncbi:MAG: isoprenyl transferase [Lachnospiraceae bacterium]|nr:isoprenyl transferase [Lachnospiraceae bacterium]